MTDTSRGAAQMGKVSMGIRQVREKSEARSLQAARRPVSHEMRLRLGRHVPHPRGASQQYNDFSHSTDTSFLMRCQALLLVVTIVMSLTDMSTQDPSFNAVPTNLTDPHH